MAQQAETIKIECANPNCHNLFTPKNAQHGFCSAKCRRAARGTSWRFVREAALIRDKDACQDCQASGCALDVHHLTPLCKGGDNNLANLVSLCKVCHRIRHKSWGKSIKVDTIKYRGILYAI
jgi:5-methylcytosine-specific restriction endonuclease McrA